MLLGALHNTSEWKLRLFQRNFGNRYGSNLRSGQEVVNECGGDTGKIDTIGLFKVVNYQECLQKLEPHIDKLIEINP